MPLFSDVGAFSTFLSHRPCTPLQQPRLRCYQHAAHRLIVRGSRSTPAASGGPPTPTRGLPLPLNLASRRAALAALLAAAPATLSCGAQALPLAPLGSAQRVGGSKLTGLSVEEVKDVLERDLREGQYFVTGDLTLEVFADDCRFADPTNDIVGLSRYVKALGLLFDPRYSVVRLLGIKVTGPRQIEADWVLGGYLRFPWNPRVEPFEGHTVYTLNEEGLVQSQVQQWNKSAATALLESFSPTAGPRSDIKELRQWPPAS